jgi:homoserine kinase type II
VSRRLDRARDWTTATASGWRIPLHAGREDPIRPWAERAWLLLERLAGSVPALLAPWAKQALPLQPCLCDVWHDHLLFEGDRLTGLVDFGAVKVDHVAVDLARLLGSLVGDEDDGWETGCAAYRAVRPLTADEETLARALDRTGTIIGAANWLLWLYREGRAYQDLDGVTRRLAAEVERMERWPRP